MKNSLKGAQRVLERSETAFNGVRLTPVIKDPKFDPSKKTWVVLNKVKDPRTERILVK